ncbi:angiopoietin-related protein 4-like [Takifugu flavidus]|uniref:Angiopoietin-related protein 4 n=1 Tax=Takifugu flavidus TaxID=433684 RepID=A0A5C6MS35_9TELE|nr:angiopoietin-related protein 4-like [Takifugu flavidus]TWW58104.1 Angiopoietin-related protein 4 [Takifugu flavidus]
MKMPQLIALVSSTLVGVSAAFPPDRRALLGQDKYASWDDVNVVSHGLLQLGQGLKEHVDKTKAQTRDVNAKLKSLDAAVEEVARRQREQDEALRAGSKEAEDREKLLAALAEEVEEVKKQSKNVNSKVDKLEEKLEDGGHAGASRGCLQKMVAAQNRRIDQLVEKLEQQQDKLDKQSLHLQMLQTKVSHKRLKPHRRRDGETAARREETQQATGGVRDCHHLYVRGQRASGVYTIQPEGSEPFAVFCDMTSEGGWTVIQKRYDGAQNFNQLWEGYKRGFGSLDGEFWLGLEKIRSVSKQGPYQLQVELSDGAGQQLPVARYRFQLDGEEEKFALHLEDEAPSPRKSTGSSGIPFSTADRDNDLSEDVSCAKLLSGGWWFSSCGDWNLNGRFPRRPSGPSRKQTRKMFWTSKGQRHSVRTTLLKIAPTTMKLRSDV